MNLGRRRVALFAVLLAGALAVAVVALATGSTRVTRTACGPVKAGNEATASLHVKGAQMVGSDGDVVVPYGVSIVGGPQTTNWAKTERASVAQIVAAHRYWHSNTVRLQVSENLLFANPTRGRSFNVPYARSVDRLVCRILAQGDIPVINDMTLFTGWKPGPTQQTVRFWRFISRRYGNRFPVIFDLYNEPQLTRTGPQRKFLSHARAWQIWRSGARLRGVVYTFNYVGMQGLVNAIRLKERVRNVIWAEEPYYLHPDDSRFNLLPRYSLKGPDIVYTFHKPNMDQGSRSFTDVRNLAAKGIPLMDSEWGQFAATDRPWMCQADSYRTAPPYLQYLHDAGIGMLSWSLQPGSLVKGIARVDTVHDGNDARWTTNPRDLSQPTEMTPSYGCTRAALGQGTGRWVMDYFASYSRRPPQALFPKLG